MNNHMTPTLQKILDKATVGERPPVDLRIRPR